MIDNCQPFFHNNVKKNIRSKFGKNVQNYIKYGEPQQKTAQILFDQIIDQVSDRQIMKILEIGCGTGFLSEYIAASFKDAQYFISDLSIEMVENCRKNIAAANPNYLVCDGELLPFNHNMDLIAANMSLHWFESFKLSIQNLFKMTQILAFSIPISGTFHFWQQAHEVLGIKNRMMPFYSKSELREMLLENKPKDLSIKVIDLSVPIASGLEFLQYLKLIGATASITDNVIPYTIAELKNLCQQVDRQLLGKNANYKIAICILRK